jgi:hypothetical protein
MPNPTAQNFYGQIAWARSDEDNVAHVISTLLAMLPNSKGPKQCRLSLPNLEAQRNFEVCETGLHSGFMRHLVNCSKIMVVWLN